MGLIPAIYLSLMMKRVARNQSGNSDLSINNMNMKSNQKLALAFQRFRLNSEAGENVKYPLGGLGSPGASSQFGANIGRFVELQGRRDI